jgi:nucleotide-binding universal stress UspA family protein
LRQINALAAGAPHARCCIKHSHAAGTSGFGSTCGNHALELAEFFGWRGIMSLRNILVHAAEDARNGDRIGLACDLALQNEATVTGLFVKPFPIIVPAMPPGGAVTVIEDLRGVYVEAAGRARKIFEETADAKGVAAVWREDEGETSECLAFQSRYADLTVIGQWSPDDPSDPGTADLGASVALDSGRPVLVVPYAGTFSVNWKRIMVAWDSSRAATRALHDAMDFLIAADRVDVVCIDPEDSADRDPGADIAAHLAHHGVKAEAHRMPSGDLYVSDAIVSATTDMGADLLVMGAYGHARFRELVFGGVTRAVLEHMPVPVMMSH